MNDTQHDITVKATDLFLNLGFKSVTMDDLASHMAMSKKTLYSHFKNKEALVEASTMFLNDQIYDQVEYICNHSSNPIEELYDVKKMVMKRLKGEKTSPMHQLQKYYPDIYSKIYDLQFKCVHECVATNLDRGKSKGLYRDNLDNDVIARLYFIGIHGIKDQKIFPLDQFPIQELHDQYLEYHLRGIVTPQGRIILNNLINSNHD